MSHKPGDRGHIWTLAEARARFVYEGGDPSYFNHMSAARQEELRAYYQAEQESSWNQDITQEQTDENKKWYEEWWESVASTADDVKDAGKGLFDDITDIIPTGREVQEAAAEGYVWALDPIFGAGAPLEDLGVPLYNEIAEGDWKGVAYELVKLEPFIGSDVVEIYEWLVDEVQSGDLGYEVRGPMAGQYPWMMKVSFAEKDEYYGFTSDDAAFKGMNGIRYLMGDQPIEAEREGGY